MTLLNVVKALGMRLLSAHLRHANVVITYAAKCITYIQRMYPFIKCFWSLQIGIYFPFPHMKWYHYLQKNTTVLQITLHLYTSFSEMERIVMYRILRPDKIIFAIKQFISTHMGQEFIEVPALNMAASFNESSKTTPLILVLSPGCDPLASLHNFTPENSDQRPSDVKILSLGQGQV